MSFMTHRGHPPARRAKRAAGFTMIEVLVTLVLLALGLIGVIGLQARGQQAELESYQRGQALALLQDMVDRINTNRAAALAQSYVTASPVGGPGALTACVAPTIGSPATYAAYDLCDWGNELTGAAEAAGTCTTGVGNGGGCVGAMLGARGCVSYATGTELTDGSGTVEPGTGIYTVTVAWQGVSPSTVTPADTCATGDYPTDAYRRVVVATLRIGYLNTKS